MNNIEESFRQALSTEQYNAIFGNQNSEVTQEAPTEVLDNNVIRELPEVDTNKVSRFSSAKWFEAMRTISVSIVGLGGIGSAALYNIGRLNPMHIDIYDFDTVEEANMSGQMFPEEAISMSKTSAAFHYIKNNYFPDVDVFAKCAEMSEIHSTSITVCAVDNMETRKNIFNSWKRNLCYYSNEERKKFLFIDGRLSAEEFQIFCIKGDDVENQQIYAETYLFKDEDAEQTVCSYKQTTYCASMIGAMIANFIVNFVINIKCNPLIESNVPFFTFYSAYNNTIMR